MNKEQIIKLLDDYFEGCTASDQEAELRKYFTSCNVDPELMKYKGIFEYFEIEKENPSVKETEIPSTAKSKRIYPYISAIIAAACIALFIIMPHRNKNDEKNFLRGSFAVVDGKYSDDPKQISRLAISALDALIIHADNAASEMDNLIGNAEIINYHVEALKEIEK